jgi:hypothetical protein
VYTNTTGKISPISARYINSLLAQSKKVKYKQKGSHMETSAHNFVSGSGDGGWWNVHFEVETGSFKQGEILSREGLLSSSN